MTKATAIEAIQAALNEYDLWTKSPKSFSSMEAERVVGNFNESVKPGNIRTVLASLAASQAEVRGAVVLDSSFTYENGQHIPIVLVGFAADDWESRDRFAASVTASWTTSLPAQPVQPARLSGLSRVGIAFAAFGNPIPKAAYVLIDAVEAHYLKAEQPAQPKDTAPVPVAVEAAVQRVCAAYKASHFGNGIRGTTHDALRAELTRTQPVPHNLQKRLADLHLYEEIAEHYAKCAISPEALRDWIAERMD